MTKDRSFSTAIHILVTLAYKAPESTSSEELALSLRTNPGLVRRVLSKLAKAGLVQSRRGRNGGNVLAKPPGRIDLRAVYEAVGSGPVFRSFGKEPYEPCPVSCSMDSVLCELYSDLEEDLLKRLQGKKLSSLVVKVA